jgi:L-glutamine-phosphate cytidylyltransferase
MRAIILAAGRGKRLGPLGDGRPKCLVELSGKPLLERQVAALRGGGVSEIGIVRGYRADMIQLPGVMYFENPRWSETNMVSSLCAAAQWLRSGPVIVSYADIFFRRELVRELVESQDDLAIAYDRSWRMLWSRRFAEPLSDAETFRADSGGRLLEIGGKAKAVEEIKGQYMGLLRIAPAAWRAIEQLLGRLDRQARDRLDMTGLLQRLLGQRFPIATIAADGQWGEVDSADDLALYERMIEDGLLQLEA